MEDSIIGESCEQPWLPARREGTERRGSLKIGGAGGGVAPCHSGGLRLRRLFSFVAYLTAQTCPRPIHSPLSRPPHPGAWCPTHDLRGGKRPQRSGRRCGGQRGRRLGWPQLWPDSTAAGWGRACLCPAALRSPRDLEAPAGSWPDRRTPAGWPQAACGGGDPWLGPGLLLNLGI